MKRFAESPAAQVAAGAVAWAVYGYILWHAIAGCLNNLLAH